jgi:hypothetical protein
LLGRTPPCLSVPVSKMESPGDFVEVIMASPSSP